MGRKSPTSPCLLHVLTSHGAGRSSGDSWVKKFQQLRALGEEYIKNNEEAREWDFDILCNWSLAFRVMTPLPPAHDQLHDTTHVKLKRNGCPLDDIMIDEGKYRFHSCTCHWYLRYVWCVHVHAHAWEAGAITGPPTGLSSARIPSSKLERGRPVKAVRGGALGKK